MVHIFCRISSFGASTIIFSEDVYIIFLAQFPKKRMLEEILRSGIDFGFYISRVLISLDSCINIAKIKLFELLCTL